MFLNININIIIVKRVYNKINKNEIITFYLKTIIKFKIWNQKYATKIVINNFVIKFSLNILQLILKYTNTKSVHE